MRICILENEHLSTNRAPGIARYADFYERLFQEAGGRDWSFEAFETVRGAYPPSFDAYDAVVLTGSAADAFGNEPWVVMLRAVVTELLAERKKLIGICFGHQLLAHCLGAPVARAPAGWNLGCREYTWHVDRATDTIFPLGGPEATLLYAIHQDQVLALPPGARLLASSPDCPIAAFVVGDYALGIQPHPEFDAAFVRTLILTLRDRLDDASLEANLRSLEQPHDGLRIGRLMTSFVAARPAVGSQTPSPTS